MCLPIVSAWSNFGEAFDVAAEKFRALMITFPEPPPPCDDEPTTRVPQPQLRSSISPAWPVMMLSPAIPSIFRKSPMVRQSPFCERGIKHDVEPIGHHAVAAVGDVTSLDRVLAAGAAIRPRSTDDRHDDDVIANPS